jgi:hypothetical protein
MQSRESGGRKSVRAAKSGLSQSARLVTVAQPGGTETFAPIRNQTDRRSGRPQPALAAGKENILVPSHQLAAEIRPTNFCVPTADIPIRAVKWSSN